MSLITAIANLRIGTKLIAVSTAAGLLVVTLLIADHYRGVAMHDEVAHANLQRSIHINAVELKASARGVRAAVGDMRVAATSEEVRAALDYVDRRRASLDKWQAELVTLIGAFAVDHPGHPNELPAVARAKELTERYVAGAKALSTLKEEMIQLESKRLPNGFMPSTEGQRLIDATKESAMIVSERINPASLELESLANRIVEAAQAQVKEQIVDAEKVETFFDRMMLTLGAIAVALLGLSALFLIRAIARPIRALTDGMKELADGNFDVILPGLGRKDEIGDIAAAVEEFKVKSAEKARAEAAAAAEQDRKAATERAERERIATEERAERERVAHSQREEQERRAAEERDAATARVMAELDAAVGDMVRAAARGDFSHRIPLDGKDGVVRNLASGLNAMCDNIADAVGEMVGMVGALAEGDFRRRIEGDHKGLFGQIKTDANAMADRISMTLSEIKGAVIEVSNASGEISSSTTDLSQRTEEQAAGLEETSASLEEVSSTIKKNAENAQHANSLTSGAREVADRGGAVVASAVGAMSRIEDSSRKISDIIGVIDEIARQTNLLALNAAVEAARAGDAGRGFAVVASEVRSLAQRSSQAAKDIKDLITSSSGQVKEGVDLVNRAGTSLGEIVESIKSVAAIVAEIAVASVEQATAIEQVNKALSQMDEATQQNSALVEENAATAKTLESQAVAMNERVGFFRIDDDAASAPAPRATPRAAPPKSAIAQKRAKPARPHQPIQRPAPAGGAVGRMQAAVATAFQEDEWKEF